MKIKTYKEGKYEDIKPINKQLKDIASKEYIKGFKYGLTMFIESLEEECKANKTNNVNLSQIKQVINDAIEKIEECSK